MNQATTSHKSNESENNETQSACCSRSEQATCCEPSAKSACCGPQAEEGEQTAPSSCGCR